MSDDAPPPSFPPPPERVDQLDRLRIGYAAALLAFLAFLGAAIENCNACG